MGEYTTFVDSDPSFKLVRARFLFKVDFRTSVEPCTLLRWSAPCLESVECTNPVLGVFEAGLASSVDVTAMQGVVPSEPFVMAMGPYDMDHGPNPIGAVVL